MLTRLRLLFADLCWHFNETANVARATPTSYLHSQNTLWLLAPPPSTIQRTRERLERTQRQGKPQTLFLFCLSPVQRFLLQFSNFIADVPSTACLSPCVCLYETPIERFVSTVAGFSLWLQQPTRRITKATANCCCGCTCERVCPFNVTHKFAFSFEF